MPHAVLAHEGSGAFGAPAMVGVKAHQPLCGKSISGKPVARMAHTGLGVGLAANAVESSGKKKQTLSLGLAPSPDSATELDDTHSPARSPTPRGCGMEPGLVQLLAKHGCYCARTLGEVSKPEAWTHGGSLRLPAITRRSMVGQAAGSERLWGHMSAPRPWPMNCSWSRDGDSSSCFLLPGS